MSVARSVLYLDLDGSWSYTGRGRVVKHDAGAWPVDIDDLVNRAAAVLPTGGGVVILSARAAGVYGFDPRAVGEDRQAPHVDGWKVYGTGGWWTYIQAPKPAVRVAVVPWMSGDQYTLGDSDPYALVGRHGRWHDLLGASYYGTPGTAAGAALRAGFQGRVRPTWKTVSPAEWRTVEVAWRRWRPSEAPADGPRGWIGYDRVRAGLATFISLEVAPHTLRKISGHDALGHGLHFNRKMAGMWRVYASPWNHPRLPNPAGPHTPPGGGLIWRATPTIALLDDLTQEGIYGGFDVVEAYIGPGERLFRAWAEKIRDAWDLSWSPAIGDLGDRHDPGAGVALRRGLKAGYRQAHGLMGAEGAIRRSDWWNAHESLARTTIWRRMWSAACQGVWPAEVDGDCVYYPADGPQPTTFPLAEGDPAGFKLGEYRVIEGVGL